MYIYIENRLKIITLITFILFIEDNFGNWKWFDFKLDYTQFKFTEMYFLSSLIPFIFSIVLTNYNCRISKYIYLCIFVK